MNDKKSYSEGIEDMYIFFSDKIAVRKMNNDQNDKTLLLKWLTNPKLTELAWGEDAPWDIQKIEENFFEEDDNINKVACIIEYENREIGYIQYYTLDENSYRFNSKVPYEKFVDGYGMDLFIGDHELWGKGIGTDVIKAMAGYLTNTLGAKVVCADPEENNKRSVQSFTKAGFSSMGKIQNYDEPDKNSILMAVFK